LLIEVDGNYEETVEDEARKVMAICEKLNGSVKIANNIEEKNKLWEARRVALAALSRVKPTVILEDATVKRSVIPEMVKLVIDVSKKYNVLIGTFGHAASNSHPTILTDRRDSEEMKRVSKAIDEVFLKTIELDGTLSGEHGIGIAKF